MTHTIAALWYFESVDLYKLLCPHKVKRMQETHEFVTFKRDQFIYGPTIRLPHVYLVVNGRIRIGHYQENGNEVTSAILSQGEMFGELAMAGETKRGILRRRWKTPPSAPHLRAAHRAHVRKQGPQFQNLKLIGLRLMKLERKLELPVFKDARTRIVEF